MMQTKILPSGLIVIPCLNEAAHIGALVHELRPAAER
ncbi:MAG: succinoglycan biosynthesis protein exoa, partial [Mesorhizobium sp.]